MYLVVDYLLNSFNLNFFLFVRVDFVVLHELPKQEVVVPHLLVVLLRQNFSLFLCMERIGNVVVVVQEVNTLARVFP